MVKNVNFRGVGCFPCGWVLDPAVVEQGKPRTEGTSPVVGNHLPIGVEQRKSINENA